MLYKMLIGAVIENKYHLREFLGAGGFGAVFLADEVVRDRILRQVAVKIIPDNDNRQLIELMEATRLDHPHLIRSHTAGASRFNNIDLLYLVMEQAEYSLQNRLEKGKLSVTETQKLITEVAAGLDYLHRQNKVHRDLKPGNVLWVKDTWKASDFGLIRSLGNQSYAQTSNPIGTIAYMPPEAWGDKNRISTAWDIWSLGIMIVSAVTGKIPYQFDGQTQLLREVMNCHLNLPRIPSELSGIVQGCLQQNRRQRWAAQQVLQALNPTSQKTYRSRQGLSHPWKFRWVLGGFYHDFRVACEGVFWFSRLLALGCGLGLVVVGLVSIFFVLAGVICGRLLAVDWCWSGGVFPREIAVFKA